MSANNFKNVNQPKDCEIFSSKRSEQEVLVLPPNLLQKLGINLRNIENSSECLKIRDLENDPDNLNGSQEKQKFNTNFEISINETKKVMAIVDTVKSIEKSVLTSPLSWPDNALQNKKINKNVASKKLDTMENILDGEKKKHEVSLLKNNEGVFSCTNKNVNAFEENVDFDSKSSTYSNIESSKSKVNIISQQFISAEKLNNLKLHSTDKKSLIPFSINNPIEKFDSVKSISSCCKKFQCEYENNEKLAFNSLNGKSTISSENKIIISYSENIGSGYPNVCNNQENQIPSVSRLPGSENINRKIVFRENETFVANENPSNYRENNNNFEDNKRAVCCNEKKYENSETSSVLSEDYECTNVADNKVKEIADYLCQYFLPAKPNVSPKRFVTKPKICTEGVEKPGGMIKIDKYKFTKTYQNKKKNLKAQCNDALSNNFINNINIENLEIDDNVNDPHTHCVVEQLCICKDFGKLQFYDNDCEYQHIHFLKQNAAQSSSVTLFEIYNSDCIKVSEENDNDSGNSQYLDSDFDQYVTLEKNCYTKYLSYENNTEKCDNSLLDEFENEMINVNESKSMDFTHVLSMNTDKTTTGINNVAAKYELQLTDGKSSTSNLKAIAEMDEIYNNSLCGQKRKKLLQEKTFWDDYDDSCPAISKYKKNQLFIKCAVCTEELSEDNWEGHLAYKHCYISWKMGHNIDLKDEKLLSNLTRRLKEVGILKCTFCGTKKKFLKNFLKHIKICLKVAKSDPRLREEMQDWKNNSNKIVKCGVCSKEVCASLWLDHIGTEHNYQAWTSAEPPLDLDNQQQIQQHLQIILKQTGELVCAHCGSIRKYAKSYMQHIETCGGNKVDCGLDEDSANEQIDNISTSSKVDNESLNALMYAGVVKCGVCHEKVHGEEWLDHIQKEHNYLARVEGVIPLDIDDEEAVRNHLHRIRLITGYLSCAKCGLKRKVIKSFLQHINSCGNISSLINNSRRNEQTIIKSSLDLTDEPVLNVIRNVKCGVCGLDVEGIKWLDHIHKKHNYLAWIEGKPPIDVSNKEKVWQYLNNLAKKIGGLVCVKCGLNRKYVKAYLEHINNCDCVLEDSLTYDDTLDVSRIEESLFNCAGPIKCGVCTEEIDGEQWIDHIQNKHNYLAWIEGNIPLNLDNNDEILNYLKILIIRLGGLSCTKCGFVIKVAKSYLQHVNNCDGSTERNNENSIQEAESEFVYKGKVKCGVCQEEVDGEQWIDHIHKQHDYLARIEELPPVDVNDEKVVRRHLIRLKKYVKEFICNKCGQTCKLAKVYMRHLKYCDGRELREVELQDEDLSNDTNSSNPNNVCLLEDSNVYQKGNVKCGVCQAEMEGADWLNHIQTEHNYLARVEGKPLLNIEDTEQVKLHLYSISKQIDGLVCSKCGGTRKYVKAFLQHIKNCDGKSFMASECNSPSVTSEQSEEEIQLTFTGTVVCGVCKIEVDGDQWIEHIQKKHNYLAHVEGNTPLNLKDQKQVQRHLNVVCKYTGGLYCAKCGLMRMYVKSFLRHIRNCDSNMVSCDDINALDQTNNSHEIDTTNNSLDNSNDLSEFVYTGIAKCGVCQAKVEGEDWIYHIQNEHNYLAWIDGKTPIDLENIEQVHAHLHSLSKFNNGLICKACGIKRKYVKSFLDHIDSCRNTINSSVIDGDNLMECAVCLEKVKLQDWKRHAMNNHYNIAWATGMEPIDLRNPYTVEKYLKEYKQANKSLICKICKTSRVSCAGFYAHIITCGKTEEEIDFYKSYCDICNCKYLCIYKNQHLGMHREQEFIKVKKVKERVEKVWKDNTDRKGNQGRRKAAERANNVLENYKTCMDKFKHKCSSCGFGTDLETELEDHSCETHSDRVSDSDVSVKFDGQTEEESDSDVDSNISMEEAEDRDNKKKRYVDLSAKVPRLLFKVSNASRYVSQGAADFTKMHYTVDVLFPQWITSEYQELDSKDLPKYLPILEESCKVKIANEGWTTYKRFEAKRNKVTSLFAGGSIRCVAWVPVRAESVWETRGESCNYLAVASHAGPDAPRLLAAQHVAHRSLVQLWRFADFTGLPEFVLGIAHDYGTVWAMDWCPSGVRDHQPNNEKKMSTQARLGLLAIACSNGSAYIFVVPYPNVGNLKNQQIIKIKPSAELRLCRGVERSKHQATAICWSQQKGHSVILVGYSDGTTAFYNFDCDSPLLKTIEDGVTIIYPFQDDRPHNTCISDVGLFPSYGESGCGWGAWSGASCTGAHAALYASAPRLHAPLATARATFTPHWPSVIVTADEAIANHTTNELEWHGGGRRLGGQRALATCLRCGLGVAYVPPVLRVTRTHPAYRDQRRDIVGFIHMAPIAKKRSKHVNDDLSMKVEPLIYEDAIKEYGLEFKLKIHMDKGDNNIMFRESKQHFPERFPLADVTSMSFCTSPSSHAKLAVATHAGLIFIINI